MPGHRRASPCGWFRHRLRRWPVHRLISHMFERLLCLLLATLYACLPAPAGRLGVCRFWRIPNQHKGCSQDFACISAPLELVLRRHCSQYSLTALQTRIRLESCPTEWSTVQNLPASLNRKHRSAPSPATKHLWNMPAWLSVVWIAVASSTQSAAAETSPQVRNRLAASGRVGHRHGSCPQRAVSGKSQGIGVPSQGR